MDHIDLTHPPDPSGDDQPTGTAGETAISDLLPLVGSRAILLNPRRASREGSKGDIDVAVEDLDPLWPLRLPAGWRLCQVLHYDIKGWYWVLEHLGETVAVDTIDDPQGLGRDGIPTQRIIGLADEHPDAATAAYLTAKRIRKSTAEPHEWARITRLARSNEDYYRRALSWIFGHRIANRLEHAVLAGQPPSAEIARQARAAQWLRRRRRSSRLLASLLASAGRWRTRVVRPTGLFVVVAGPDGTGKSTLAEALPAICEGPFRRWMHLHWRPGILPRLSSIVGTAPGDPTKPHSKSSHGAVGSVASLAYHWIDFFVGGWLRFAPFRARSGLIVLERGWLDIAVDPRRYRIAVPRTIVRMLGHTLLQPDLIIVLEAAPGVLMARKAEVERGELERQTRAWREVIPRRTNRVYIDASSPAEDVRAAAREAVFSILAERATASLGSGWIGLPTRSSPRWILPRGPRRSALSALSIYQPVTVRARLGWEVGRGLAAAGLLHLFPRGQAPPASVRSAVARYMPPRSTLAVLRANHPGRFLALVIDSSGRPYAIAKVASDETGIATLEAEARNIEGYAHLLERPLRAPEILAREPGLLLLQAERWMPRGRPWFLPPEVAYSLGRAYARSLSDDNGSGMAHGDCAPWNLLKTEDGWVLVDWEEARSNAPPFFDLFHFVVQGHVLLGRPSLRELTDAARHTWVRTAIEAYARGAGLPTSSWPARFVDYLTMSMEGLDPADPDQARALDSRKRIVQAIHRSFKS